MKWQETVKTDGEFEKWCHKHRKYESGECHVSESCAVCHRKVQAEITGDIAFKAGIREVVEWVESLPDTPTESICEGTNIRVPEPPAKLVFSDNWQAKLKEWGIDHE